MLSFLFKELVRPTSNRYYLGRRNHLIQFIITSIPILLITVFITITDFTKYWWVPLGALAILLIMYFITDWLRDKIEWSIKKRYYQRPEHSKSDQELFQLMKDYEQAPTPEKRAQLAERMKI